MEEEIMHFRGPLNLGKTVPTKILELKIVNATQLITTDVLNQIVASLTKVSEKVMIAFESKILNLKLKNELK